MRCNIYVAWLCRPCKKCICQKKKNVLAWLYLIFHSETYFPFFSLIYLTLILKKNSLMIPDHDNLSYIRLIKTREYLLRKFKKKKKKVDFGKYTIIRDVIQIWIVLAFQITDNNCLFLAIHIITINFLIQLESSSPLTTHV